MLVNSQLFKTINQHILEYDGKVILCKGKYCAGKSKCYGIFYFDSKMQPIIKVATGNKSLEECLIILIHEYSHFLQWATGCKLWQAFEDADFNFNEVICDPVPNKDKILLLLQLELDCEKRSLKLIKKYGLSDMKKHCKIANSILYKYAYLYNYAKWPKSRNLKWGHINNLPDQLLKSQMEYLNIPDGLLRIFNSEV